MNRRRFFIFTFLLLSIGSFVYIFIGQKEEKIGKFFISVPIEKYSSRIPVLQINVEGKSIPMQLDLGFQGAIEFFQKDLSEIQDKTFKGCIEQYGFRGNKYEKKIYSIPKIQIGDITFFNLPIHEASSEQEKDSKLRQPIALTEGEGCLGWQLFENSNLLLNCPEDTIGFFDSIETLKEHGYDIDTFVKAPLLLDRGILEFMVDTDEGRFRCFLDTGASWNIMNGEIKEGYTLEEWAASKENHYGIAPFKIEGIDFGMQPFCTVPLKYPFHVDAILGMQFIEKRVIAIDFANRYIYFSPKAFFKKVIEEDESSQGSL